MIRKKVSLRLVMVAAALLGFLPGSSAGAALPILSLSQTTVTFMSGGGSVPPQQTVSITSDQPVMISGYTISYTGGGSWLTVFPPNFTPPQTTPVNLTLYVTPGTLPAGIYAAQVSVQTTTAIDTAASTTSIGVFLMVGGSSETITVAPASLSFSFQPGNSVPAAQSVTVSTSDNANVNITAVTNDGKPWLLFSPASLSTTGALSISVNPSTLASGTYTGNVTVSAPNTVAQIPVTLTVGTSGLTVAPGSVSINEPQNYGLSASQPLTIQSASPIPIQLSAFAPDGNWLQLDQNNATTPATVNVRANDSGLPQGTYQGTISVQSGPSEVVNLPVTLTVGAPAVLSLQPSGVSFTYQIAGPTPPPQTVKVGSLNSSTQTFAVASVTNDGGTWLNAAVMPPGNTPGTVTVAVNPANLLPGSYSGQVNVTAGVMNASPQPIVVSLTVKPAPVPVIKSVNSSSSYATGAVAPGEIVTIFGSNIGPATLTVPPAGNAPTTLANTSVTFDGIPAPIYYASSTQTSVQVPYGIAAGQTSLKVTYNTAESAATNLNSVPALPGLFTVDSSGQRQAAALNADLSLNSPANPAKRGAALVLYGTGEGKTNPPSIEGLRAPLVAPFPQTPLPVTVTIGGQNAPVLYAGETPGLLSGLFQINVTVPAGTPVGSTIPVQVTINGQASQSNVTVAIQ